jgi:prepilin-type N-terminal cleavage/methylation domain-containing protein
VKQKKRGFTLVEILTTVAIIAILVGLLFLGAKHVGASARAKRTEVTLKSLQGMLTEFESRGGRMDFINKLYPNAPDLQETMPNQPPNTVFQGDAAYDPSQMTINPALAPQLARTQAVMRALVSVPENKAILDKLMTNPDNYLKNPPLSAQPKQPLDGPILLDGWGSPILFAPGRMNTLSKKWGATGLTIKGDPATPNASVQPPDGKGMFISAGPDSDFSKGDDNLYTYEK